MKTKDEIINTTIARLKELTGEDFHGYRSEIWNVLSLALKHQDRNTRHACAESVISCGVGAGGERIWKDDALAACMNTKTA